EGYARHLAVRDDGTVYLALTVRMGRGSNMGVVAMRDTDGDRVADVTERFAADIPATALVFFEDDLYVGANTAVYRFRFDGSELVPSAAPEVVVDGFPEQRLHEAKTFAIDAAGNLYVNVGAPSNACMVEFRTRGSPGQRPCPHLVRQGGIWRYDARASGQTQADDGDRYATGVRNAVAIEYNAALDRVYFLSHGRDALYSLFPEYYTAEESAELPSEEMHVLAEGADYGWPYTYYDHVQGKRLVAPEYGGDGTMAAEAGLYRDPIATFPGHWAPNDLLFYSGEQLPERYRGGAFIVFHGSWNRAPLPQEGYKIAFRPFRDGEPAADWEVFADGFKGADVLENPADAVHRPMSIAQGAGGELYVSSTVSGRVWRIDYVGAR
ncbi:MAG TPA: PQQ-dependent sugar dehydrogenase, partial [Gammaproteobacteria bacterium]|nr:PQQ-dependent sugar dehydrogenase [Gammaproteobacteria bacterium]